MGDDVKTLSKDEVFLHIKNGTAAVVNVLGKRDYDKIHIKGSVSIPFDILEAGELGALKGQRTVITYCKGYNCGASLVAARLLNEMGLTAMAYEGGMEEWQESGLPVEGTSVKS